MELFKNTNFDFLKWKWPFIGASLVLTVLGIGSLILKGGPRYGIEFKGGMLMTVKFAQAPNLEQIRSVLTKALPSPPSVETFENGSNEVQIGTEGGNEGALAKNRDIVLATLAKTYGQPGNGKLDVNNSGASEIANRLRDPLQKAGAALSDPQVDQLGASIAAYRDQHGGIIANINDLRSVPGVTPQVMNVISQQCYASSYTASRNFETVGPKVGADLTHQAINATLLALAGMLVYIWFRFEWIYGVGAVIAVFHDTIITIGLFSLFNKEITLTVVAAILTLVGYSMNDTIVIFDRIRENLHLNRREPLGDVINRSINQTLSRTIMTSGLTFLTVLALFLFGGPVLHGFSFALVVGIIIGTYSSVFVASPIVLFWHNYADRGKKTAPPVSTAPRSDAARQQGSRSSVRVAGKRPA
jgi:preprotein translocase subunit SecF